MGATTAVLSLVGMLMSFLIYFLAASCYCKKNNTK